MENLTKENLPDTTNPCYQVRRTCQKVCDFIKKQEKPSVIINESKIEDFVKQLEEKVRKEDLVYDPWSQYHINPNDYPLEQVLAYTFIVDALNFCFWPGDFSFEYENLTSNLAKLIPLGFFEPKNLQTVESSFLKENVFSGLDFSLIDERARLIREVGYLIHNNYHDSFVAFVGESPIDAPKLVKKITMELSGFRDEAIYKGEQVFFYKRAQILVADLYGAMMERKDQQLKFENMEQITMFADYRVPQTLRLVGIFEYSDHIASLVDKNTILAYSSEEEVEIRAATVVAVEMIMSRIKESESLKSRIKYSFEIDWLLWQMGEKNLKELQPHHRVLSIFY